MANFFYATAKFADGHVEHFHGQLWFLGGAKCTEGHAQLKELLAQVDAGIIVSLDVDYES